MHAITTCRSCKTLREEDAAYGKVWETPSVDTFLHLIGPARENCEPNNAALMACAWVTNELDYAQSIKNAVRKPKGSKPERPVMPRSIHKDKAECQPQIFPHALTRALMKTLPLKRLAAQALL
jgi:hypothetical protein